VAPPKKNIYIYSYIYIYIYILICPDNLRKKIKKEVWIGLEQIQEPRVYNARQILTTGDKKVLESCVFLVLYTVTIHGRSRRRKKDTSKLSAEEGTENRYRLTDAEVRQRNKTKDIVEVTHSVKWKWRAHVVGMD